MASILFKNVVQRNWGARKGSSSRSLSKTFSHYKVLSFDLQMKAFIDDDIKNAIKKVLPDFLTRYQMKAFRSQLDDAVRIISKTDYPESFVPLFQYFISNLKDFNTLIAANNPPDFLSDVVFNFFQTLNMVTKEQLRRRTHNTKDMFYNYYAQILAEFSKIWTTFNSSFKTILENVVKSNNENNLERFMRLVRFYDKIVINLLLCGFDELHLE